MKTIPKCADCGKESWGDVQKGIPDEIPRCGGCRVKKVSKILDDAKERMGARHPIVTIVMDDSSNFFTEIRAARDFSLKHPDTIVVLDPRKLPRKKKKTTKPS